MAKIGGGKTPAIPSAVTISVIVTVLFLLFMAAGAAAQSISFAPAEKTVSQGSATTLDVMLDNAPMGLAGYEINLSLTSPDKAEIVSVEFPDWAGLNKNGSFPADNVMISGVDLGRKVQAGSKDILLATITVRGDSPGSTEINIIAKEIDADGGSPVKTEITPGLLKVQKAATASTPGPAASSPATASATEAPTEAAVTESLVPPYMVMVLALVALAGLSIMIIKMWKGKS